MFGDYFYNQTMRRMTIAFGQIFNNIQIKRKDSNGNVVQSIRVPLAYAPKEKFLTRLDQQPNLNDRQFAVTLPRLSFEITGLSYDGERKLTRVQKYKTVKSNVDGIGNADQILKEKFGEKVIIKNFEKPKGFIARKWITR